MANVTWITPLNGSSQSANVLTKTAADSWTNAENYTSNSHTAGSASTTYYQPTTGGNVRMGYSTGTPPARSGLTFSWQFGGLAEVYESDVMKYNAGSYTNTDQFSITTDASNVVTYQKNGVTVYTSASSFAGTQHQSSVAYAQNSKTDITVGTSPSGNPTLLPPPPLVVHF